MRFILGAKPGGREPEVRAFLFDWVDNTPGTRAAEFAGEDGVLSMYASTATGTTGSRS